MIKRVSNTPAEHRIMIKDVLCELDYSFFAETALLLFFCSFLGILAHTLWSNPEAISRQAELPLRDGESVSR
jgi:hypothetical protein